MVLFGFACFVQMNGPKAHSRNCYRRSVQTGFGSSFQLAITMDPRTSYPMVLHHAQRCSCALLGAQYQARACKLMGRKEQKKKGRVLPRCVDIRASSGISAALLPLGPLCSTWPVGTPRGAKLPLGDTLGHAGPVGAWGFAGAYHKGLVVSVHPPPRTNPVPKTATNRQPNQE